MITGNNIEIIKSTCERVGIHQYKNELIVIDIDTYKRHKIEFYTICSDFTIIKEKKERLYFKGCEVNRDVFCKIEDSREIVKKDDIYFNITELD